jgi:hypothetical protein
MNGEGGTCPSSAVGHVKEVYRRASDRQRAMLRSWFRLVLSGEDGNDGRGSRKIDRLAAGADGPDRSVSPPRAGQRCPRCHRRRPPARCALCAPGAAP